MLLLADGPDEVHQMVLARRELNRWAKRAEANLKPRHTTRMVWSPDREALPSRRNA